MRVAVSKAPLVQRLVALFAPPMPLGVFAPPVPLGVFVPPAPTAVPAIVVAPRPPVLEVCPRVLVSDAVSSPPALAPAVLVPEPEVLACVPLVLEQAKNIKPAVMYASGKNGEGRSSDIVTVFRLAGRSRPQVQGRKVPHCSGSPTAESNNYTFPVVYGQRRQQKRAIR